MLKSLDILIGFSVIMLVVSMSVTLIIQWIVHALGMRGKELLKGLTALVQQIDPLLKPHAEVIARQILTNPMLARAGEKLAGVVQREELIKTMLEIASGAAPQLPQPAAAAAGGNAAPVPNPPAPHPPEPTPAMAPPAASDAASDAARQALATALKNLGISDPGKTLDAIRLFSMRLEASQPELATHVREATAVITEAESRFVAKVNGWFDPTMERVSQSFTNQSRYWTAGISLVLALLLQLDAFKIVNRLAIDDTLRAKLVETAPQIGQSPGSAPKPQASDAQNAAPPNTQNGQPASQTSADLEKATQDNMAQLRVLATDKLITWPTWSSGKTWADNWNQFWGTWWAAWDGSKVSLFGVLLSAMLLSFGAPFWFNMLGDLLKLRPILASKDDQQRQERESSQTPSDGGGSPPSPLAAASASGERGDLTVVAG